MQLADEKVYNFKKFVCKMYNPSTKITKIDQMRVKIMFNKEKDPDSLPPTSDAVKLHMS